MQGTQYATKRSILCRGAFCGPIASQWSSRSTICHKLSSTAMICLCVNMRAAKSERSLFVNEISTSTKISSTGTKLNS